MHKNIVFKDPVGLMVDGLVSKRYGLIFPINYRIILRRSNYESNFKVLHTVSKSTKHGYTSLILPTKPFKTDLTNVLIYPRILVLITREIHINQPSSPQSARRYA